MSAAACAPETPTQTQLSQSSHDAAGGQGSSPSMSLRMLLLPLATSQRHREAMTCSQAMVVAFSPLEEPRARQNPSLRVQADTGRGTGQRNSHQPAARACHCACRWCGRPTRPCCAAPPCPSAAPAPPTGLQQFMKICEHKYSLLSGLCEKLGEITDLLYSRFPWRSIDPGDDACKGRDGRLGSAGSGRGLRNVWAVWPCKLWCACLIVMSCSQHVHHRAAHPLQL